MNVVITGASSGIGAATAIECSRRGMRVVLAARRAELLEQVAAKCRDAVVVPTDVTSPDDIEALMTKAGTVDVLVANAGVPFHRPLAEATDNELRDIIETNVLGVMRCARAIAPAMIARRSGHIIVVSSVAADLTWPNDSVYGATKAAVHRFALGLASELEPFGVHVTDIVPGVIDTPLTDRLRGSRKTSPETVARAIAAAIEAPRRMVVIPARHRAQLSVTALLRWLGRR